MHERASTGIKGFDQMSDMLRMGDNVVWQVDSIEDYRYMTDALSRRQSGSEKHDLHPVCVP